MNQEQIKELTRLVDDIYYLGVDAGSEEYGDEYWTPNDYVLKILNIINQK